MVELDQISQIVLQSVGVLWGSFFCSFAFVLPRLLAVAKSRSNAKQERQSFISTNFVAETSSLRNSSLLLSTSQADARTGDSKKHLEFLHGSDDDVGFDDENFKLEERVMCQPETLLMGTSSADSFIVSSNKPYNNCENRIEPEHDDANSPNECVLVSQNGSTPLAVAHDGFEYSSTSHMCSDQTEDQGKNKENVSNGIDMILGAITVSQHSPSSPVANVTKEEGYLLEKNSTSNSIVETVSLSSSNTPNSNEDNSYDDKPFIQ